MMKYNDNTINKWYHDGELIKVYYHGAVCYYKITSGDTPTPVQEPCFAVVDDITQYSETEFEDVYDKATEKWYKLNNLNEYEEYGVYGEGKNITYYEGKLTIDGDYEYEWNGSSWVNVGEVTGSQITEWVDYQTLEFSRSYPAMNKVRIKPHGTFYSIYISPTANTISTDSKYRITNTSNNPTSVCITYNGTRYKLSDFTEIESGVYEFTLPTTCYFAGSDYYINTAYKKTSNLGDFLFVEETIGSVVYPVYYDEMQAPPNNLVFSSMSEALAYECPWVGMYASINGKQYMFDENYEWVEASYRLRGVLNGVTYDIFGTETEVTSGDVQTLVDNLNPSYDKLMDVYVGSNITSLAENAFSGRSTYVKSIYIPSSVKTVGVKALYFPNNYNSSGFDGIQFSTFDGVTIHKSNFEYCVMQETADFSNATFVNNTIQNEISFTFVNVHGLKHLVLPSTITKIYDMDYCYDLETLTIKAVQPPSISSSILTHNTPLTAIYVPAQSVDAYKAASGWNSFSSIIQAIQT